MARVSSAVRDSYERGVAWFSLKKYDQQRLRELNHYEWALQIALRRDIIRGAEIWHSNQPHKYRETTLGAELYELFAILKKCPIVRRSDVEYQLRFYQPRTYLDMLSLGAESNMTVRPVTVAEYWLHQFDMREAEFAYARRFFSDTLDTQLWCKRELSYSDLSERSRQAYVDRLENHYNADIIPNEHFEDGRPAFDQLLNEPMHSHVSQDSLLFLALDRNAPDKQILDDLGKLLKRFRKRNNTPKKKKLDLYSWVYNGLLPYMDLQVWATLNHIGRVPDWLAQRALNEGYGDRHTINAVTSKLCDAMVTGEAPLWRLLRAIAADEIRRERIARRHAVAGV